MCTEPLGNLDGKISSYIYIFLFFLLISFIVSATCTCFTPLVPSVLGKHDQAMFYMQGKAICHGMVPYVDFADVKGPLLLYLFAMGYWIDPDGVWGMVLLLTATYTFTLGFLYLTARLLGVSRRMAIISVLLTLFVMSSPFLVVGADGACRAEDYIAATVSCLLYFLVRYYTYGRSADAKLLGLVAGFSFACAILIKYNNMLAPVAVLVLALLPELYHRRYASASAVLLCFVGGASALLAVFSFVLWRNDALIACKEIYLDFNMATLRNMSHQEHMVRAWLVSNKFFYAIPVLLAVATCRMLVTGMKTPWFLTGKWVLSIFVSAVCIPNLMGPFGYYFAACFPLALLVIIPIFRRFSKLTRRRYFFLTLVLVLAYILKFNGVWCRMDDAKKFVENTQIVEQEIAGLQNPTIIYDYLDIGLGLRSCVLPGCVFWCGLNGGYERCRKNQLEAIKNRKVDFCCLRYNNPQYLLALESSGYCKLCDFSNPGNGAQYVVYKKCLMNNE